mgnify:CR=1 FL=1
MNKTFNLIDKDGNKIQELKEENFIEDNQNDCLDIFYKNKKLQKIKRY